MASVDLDTKVEVVDDYDQDDIKTGKKIKYLSYTVRGNQSRVEERKNSWKPFNIDVGGAKGRYGAMQRDNVWYSSYIKHKELDIVQKMQKNVKTRDKTLEEFEKRLLDIDTGRTQEEMRMKELERKIAMENKKEKDEDDIDLRSVRIENIPPECDEEELKEIFSEFGQVWRVRMPVHYDRKGNPQPHKKKGFAFLHFETEAQAKKAVDAAEIEYGFAILTINYAKKAKSH